MDDCPDDTSYPFQAGRAGPEVRGDVWFGYDPDGAGGLELDFESRVEAMFGASTRAFLLDLAREAGLERGRLAVRDRGAVPWVLRARFEALARRALDRSDLLLAPEVWGPFPVPRRERPRRSRLYLPGNEPKYMHNAALHHPDGVILDLEDSVAPAAKAEARSLVRHALHSVDWKDCERMVRINQGALGEADLRSLAGSPVDLVLLPKVEGPEEVAAAEALLQEAFPEREVLLMPILETARGVLHAEEIAAASPRCVALTLGLEDLTADLGVVKTREGRETLWARSRVVFAARAFGLQAIDSVYGDVEDEEGLRASCRESRALGFEGKGCVHPRQIRVVHEEFAPSPQEVERALRIQEAFEAARARGEAVVSLGSRMIDPPVVKRALQTVQAAREAGLLPPGAGRREGGQA